MGPDSTHIEMLQLDPVKGAKLLMTWWAVAVVSRTDQFRRAWEEGTIFSYLIKVHNTTQNITARVSPFSH